MGYHGTWATLEKGLRSKLADPGAMSKAYDKLMSLPALASGSLSVGPMLSDVRAAVDSGRMSKASGASILTRAFLVTSAEWRALNPRLAHHMDASATEDAARLHALASGKAPPPRGKRGPEPRDPTEAERFKIRNDARAALDALRAEVSQSAPRLPPPPARSAVSFTSGAPPASPPPPRRPKLSAYHEKRAAEIGASEAEYLRTIGPGALANPSEALTQEARSICAARGHDPSIFAERVGSSWADRARYLLPDYR